MQKFLTLKSEESIAKLERLLSTEIKSKKNVSPAPMTVDELNKRIERSEADFKAGHFKESAELLKKYEQ